MFHADNAYYLPAATHHHQADEDPHRVEHGVSRLRRPAGHDGGRAAIDEIAWTLGLDPLDVRKRNLYGEGRDVTPYGMRVTDNILPPLIETLEAHVRLPARGGREIATFNAESARSQARASR